uniref:Anaphase-promoting complex subunit 11 RING-H2 finger domain-containing protein n=1 Tax=Trichogramma kaykai TaxID=54128 RepID=A0ABD2X5Z2_9HYME
MSEVEKQKSQSQDDASNTDVDGNKSEKMFTLKKWNAVAMWSWDVECDTCAICRVQVMGRYNKKIEIFIWNL